jgi:hypothetical protein
LRIKKTKSKIKTKENAECDRKRRRNEFKHGNIICNIFRNCTGHIGEDISARDEHDGMTRYGQRGFVEVVATTA